MGHTKSDKEKLGKDWIDKLQLSYECHDFHAQVLKCDCISKLSDEELVSVKVYFKDLVEIFWMEDYHVSNRSNFTEIGTCFGHFLLPACTLNSQRPHLQFKIGEKNYYTFCLPTLTRMFGLAQKACTAARAVLTDKKTVGLNLLKIGCEVNIKKKVFKSIFDNFWHVWNHQVVPVSWNNAEAVNLIETTLKGLIINLDGDMKDALEYINKNHTPLYKKLDPVSHGGENIRFGSPKNLEPWNSFDDHPKMKVLPNKIKECLSSLWGQQNMVFKYKPSYIFSQLTSERDNSPQKAHMDFDPNVIK